MGLCAQHAKLSYVWKLLQDPARDREAYTILNTILPRFVGQRHQMMQDYARAGLIPLLNWSSLPESFLQDTKMEEDPYFQDPYFTQWLNALEIMVDFIFSTHAMQPCLFMFVRSSNVFDMVLSNYS